MKTDVTILETNLEVEYDITITASGSPQTGPSYSSGGEPAEPCEFDVTVLSLSLQGRVVELPRWLKDLIETDLCCRDDICEIANEMDQEEPEYEPPDDES